MTDETKEPKPPSDLPQSADVGDAKATDGEQGNAQSQADAEKAAKITEAKARVASAKQAGGDKLEQDKPGDPAKGPPKAPVKKKEEGPKPTDATDHPLVQKVRRHFKDAVLEASEFIRQLSIRIAPSSVVAICDFLKRDTKTPFNYLTDVTCVHLPDRAEAPFEMIYNLYSISTGDRVRLNAAVGESEGIESVTSVWPAANWMEREVFDLFGVNFRNHPDLRRILLPPDWVGHPLRKEYPLEFVENNWTSTHLPVFTEVQKEQLEQRRAYGLEVLSMPAEREVRAIFRSGKEVMVKDK